MGALNAAIRALANSSDTDNIFLADVHNAMYETYDTNDFWDDVHLSQQGATKTANVWFDAVVAVLNKYPGK